MQQRPLRLLTTSSSTRFPRFPATTLLLGALLIGAVVTGTTTSGLSAPWLRRVGFSPQDLWELDLVRLLTSTLVTHGPRVLFVALIMTALSVGLVERQAGWRAALAVFWGVHLLTMILSALILRPLQIILHTPALETLMVMRDVGPSAGYFGSLGFGLALTKGRTRTLAAASVLVFLGLDALGIIRPGSARPQEFPADLSHLLALSLGWSLGLLLVRRRRREPAAQS